MKSRVSRTLLTCLVVTAFCLNSIAATRICSVYLESYSALQKQLFLGAETFQAPQLGAVPMMISAGLPGASQLDNAKPIALHVLDLGGGETGMVIEVSPSECRKPIEGRRRRGRGASRAGRRRLCARERHVREGRRRTRVPRDEGEGFGRLPRAGRGEAARDAGPARRAPRLALALGVGAATGEIQENDVGDAHEIASSSVLAVATPVARRSSQACFR